MNKYYYEGKTEEDAIGLALEDLKISREDLIINNVEDKSGLLKKLVKIEVLNMNEIVSFVKKKRWKPISNYLFGKQCYFNRKKWKEYCSTTTFT